ncbi:MAG TPA: YCF48-related protein [Longimicrobiales bacterium]
MTTGEPFRAGADTAAYDGAVFPAIARALVERVPGRGHFFRPRSAPRARPFTRPGRVAGRPMPPHAAGPLASTPLALVVGLAVACAGGSRPADPADRPGPAGPPTGSAASVEGRANAERDGAVPPTAALRALLGRPTLTPQESGTTALLQAVSAVSDRIVWVSGHRGTVLRTTDGGRSWQRLEVPGADSLEFRDIHAVDERTAYLLSAGPGELSRIYKTTDGGRSWTLQFRNAAPDAFYDCLAFWDERRGIVFSDAVAGEVILRTTDDGGAHWTRVPPDRVPDAQPGGEGAFAASGTCVVAGPGGRGWIGTGAAPQARVFRTEDFGRTWSVTTTPVVAGDVAGIFTLAFRDALHGVALGGDLDRPDAHTDNVAVTADGGRTWSLAGRTRLPGAVFGAAYVPGAPTPTLVAVGPGGMDYSFDEGRSWAPADTAAYWAVGFARENASESAGRMGVSVRSAYIAGPGTRALTPVSTAAAGPAPGWAVGPGGRIAKIEWR